MGNITRKQREKKKVEHAVSQSRIPEAHAEVSSGDSAFSGGGELGLVLLFENVGKRPGMYLHDPKFDAAVGFVDGFNAACDGTALLGLHEWLVAKLGFGNNLAWSALVRELLMEQERAHSTEDLEARLVRGLFAILVEFLKERRSPNGLRTIFLRYDAWLRSQEWYTPGSPSWISMPPPARRRARRPKG
jgi:hypothetical protein